MAICCCPAMPIVRGGGLRGCGWLYQWCGSTPKPAREGRIEGIWGGQLTWSVSRASGEGVKKFKLQPRARSPKKLQFRKTIISLLANNRSNYLLQLQFLYYFLCARYYPTEIYGRPRPFPKPLPQSGRSIVFLNITLVSFCVLRLFSSDQLDHTQ